MPRDDRASNDAPADRTSATLGVMANPRPWLPSERASRAGAWGVALCVALALGTLAGLNVGAGELLRRAGNNLGYRLMDQKWVLARQRSDRPTVLVLGDSSGNQGVDTAVLAEVLGPALGVEGEPGLRVLNLCTIGNALTVDDAWLLAEWMRVNGPPRGVVVVHTYDVWFRRADSLASATVLSRVPVPVWEWGRLRPAVSFSGEALERAVLTRWAPLYSQDESLRELIADPKRTWRRLGPRGGDLSWQNVDADGFMAVPVGRAAATERDTRSHIRTLRQTARGSGGGSGFVLSQDNRAGLEEVARLGLEHGFPVWIAAGPMHRALWESREMAAYHADLRREVSAVVADDPSVRIVLPEATVFDAEQMQNSDHVTARAAREYTRLLGEAILRAEAR